MTHDWTEPYSSLKPFKALFKEGLAILTYHKLGRRPSGARLKGLYVSRRLFARQMRELREGGFGTASLADAPGGSPGDLRVGITFDDGFVNVLEHGVPVLADNGMRAIQFLVSGRLGGKNEWEIAEGEVPEKLMSKTQVHEWLSAGHDIGSHTATHPWLTRLPLEEAREEIVSSKKALEDLFGRPIQHFCYPYGDFNQPVRDLVAEAGYTTACTTQAGINGADTDRLALKRLTARYPSRNWKAMWRRLKRNRAFSTL